MRRRPEALGLPVCRPSIILGSRTCCRPLRGGVAVSACRRARLSHAIWKPATIGLWPPSRASRRIRAADDMKAAALPPSAQILPYAAYAMPAARRTPETVAMLDEAAALTPDDPWPRLQKALVLAKAAFDAALTILRTLPASCIERMLIAGFITFYRPPWSWARTAIRRRQTCSLRCPRRQYAPILMAALRTSWPGRGLAMSASVLGDCNTMVEAATSIIQHVPAEEPACRPRLQLRAGGHAGLGRRRGRPIRSAGGCKPDRTAPLRRDDSGVL